MIQSYRSGITLYTLDIGYFRMYCALSTEEENKRNTRRQETAGSVLEVHFNLISCLRRLVESRSGEKGN